MPSKPKTKSLGDLLKKAKEDGLSKPRRASGSVQPPLTFQTISLTPAAKATLESLIAHASQQTGRKASASAVVRALLRWAEQKNLASHVVGLIETELTTGEVVWGKSRKTR
jgi:formate dehydrogenase maturation protein FdhE